MNRAEWDTARQGVLESLADFIEHPGRGYAADHVMQRLHGERPNPEAPRCSVDFHVETGMGTAMASEPANVGVEVDSIGARPSFVELQSPRPVVRGTVEQAEHLRDALSEAIDWIREYGS